MVKQFSKRGKLNNQDWLNGLYLTVITAGLTSFEQILSSGFNNLNASTLGTILGVALSAGVSYIIKKLNDDIPSEIQIDPSKTRVIKVKE